jgi:pimeloyl-ACP methyl ester carboxylesterase
MTQHAIPTPAMPFVAGISHRWVTVRGASFHVAESASAGAGAPVVVLLHGWPQHWWCWRRVIPELAPMAHVVAIDLRGHGWSSAPRQGYLKEELADDVCAVLDELGHGRVTIVGHDWGGWVGFLAALRSPERFDALVALGIVPPFQRLSPATVANAWRGAYQLLLAAPVLGRTVLRTQPRVVAEMIRLGTVDPEAIDEPARRHYAEMLQSPERARASVQMYRTFLVHEVPHLGRYQQQRLAVPTRLLVGRADPIATDAFLRGWQDHADDMIVEVLEGVGHFIPEEAPERVVQAVRLALAA